MKSYVYVPPVVAQRVSEIKRNIYLKMNGVTADSMRESGVSYSKNYGVSLPELRQMAIRIDKDAVLANALWAEKIRETMILAILIYPVADFGVSKAEEWIADVCTLELAENLSRNLLCQQVYAGQKSVEWAVGNNVWFCSVGYFTAAFGLKMLTMEQKERLLQLMLEHEDFSEVAIYRSMALFVRKYVLEHKEMALELLSDFDHYRSSGDFGKRIIYEELKTEVEYGA